MKSKTEGKARSAERKVIKRCIYSLFTQAIGILLNGIDQLEMPI